MLQPESDDTSISTVATHPSFLSYVEPHRLRHPGGIEEWSTRLRHNLRHFAPQYCGATSLIGLGIICANPISIFAWSLFGGLLGGAIRCHYVDEIWHVRDVPMSRREQKLVLIPCCVLVLVFGGLLPTMMWILTVAGFLVGLHASFLKTTPKIVEVEEQPSEV